MTERSEWHSVTRIAPSGFRVEQTETVTQWSHDHDLLANPRRLSLDNEAAVFMMTNFPTQKGASANISLERF
jgi:hypothetical protein